MPKKRTRSQERINNYDVLFADESSRKCVSLSEPISSSDSGENSNANLNSEWTTLEISRNCDYFRGNPEDDRSMNPKRGEPKKGNQTRGIPKRGI